MSRFEVTADGAIVADPDELRRITNWLQEQYRNYLFSHPGRQSSVLNEFLSACAESVRVREVIGVPFPELTNARPETIELSVSEAAVVVGRSPEYVRRMLRAGRWPGRRVGKVWLMDVTAWKD